MTPYKLCNDTIVLKWDKSNYVTTGLLEKKGAALVIKKPFLGLVPMKIKERSVWIESVVYAEIVFTSLVCFSYSI